MGLKYMLPFIELELLLLDLLMSRGPSSDESSQSSSTIVGDDMSSNTIHEYEKTYIQRYVAK